MVVEKKHHIKTRITGKGAGKIAALIREKYPDAQTYDEGSELVEWKHTDTALDIKLSKTPGKLLRAYRERAGLTIVELAKKVDTKYPNISAMENDKRVIGLSVARKLGKALNVDYTKFIEG